MTSASFDELQEWYQNCNPDASLSSLGKYEEWYIPLDAWKAEEGDEPVELRGPCAADDLIRHILLQKDESAQLFSGFRGSGKSTELERVAERLGPEYAVLQLKARSYHYLNNPLTIEELVLILAAGVVDRARAQLGIKTGIIDEVKTRLADLAKKLKMPDLRIGPFQIKDLLLEGTTFREKLRRMAGERPGELREFLFGVVIEVAAAVSPRRLVVFLDDLEKFEAEPEKLSQICLALADLFRHYADFLHPPNCHVVYTIPPYVAFRSPGIGHDYGGRIRTLFNVRIQSSPPERTMDTAGIRALAAFLDRRVPLNRLFGPNREDCVKSMILASGGHVRDVLYLMQEVISWALKQNPYGGEQTVQLPLGPDSVVRSIKVHANRYPFLSVEMKETLRQVSRMGSLDSIADALIPFQIQALDHFMILNYHNHRQFFDIHPLIRERIEGDHA